MRDAATFAVGFVLAALVNITLLAWCYWSRSTGEQALASSAAVGLLVALCLLLWGACGPPWRDRAEPEAEVSDIAELYAARAAERETRR